MLICKKTDRNILFRILIAFFKENNLFNCFLQSELFMFIFIKNLYWHFNLVIFNHKVNKQCFRSRNVFKNKLLFQLLCKYYRLIGFNALNNNKKATSGHVVCISVCISIIHYG